MKAIKRTVAALLATLMLATSTSFTLAAEEYTDKEAVVVAKVNAAGIMTGTDKGFEPSKSLTRAEAAAIIVRMKGIAESAVKATAGTTLFNDVAASHWASGYVNQASNLGIVKGVSATEFAPEREVTIAEFTTMAIRALGAGQLVDSEGTWPTNYVNFANENGILDDVNAIYTATATRLQAATIVANTLETNMWEKVGVKSNGEIEWGKTEKDILYNVLKIRAIDGSIIIDPETGDDYVLGQCVTVSNIDHEFNDFKVDEDVDLSNVKYGLTYDFWLNDDNEIIGIWESENSDLTKVEFTEIVKVTANEAKVTLMVDGKEKEYKTIGATDLYYSINEGDDQTVASASDVFGVAYLNGAKISAIYGEQYSTYAIVDEVKNKTVTFKDVETVYDTIKSIKIDKDTIDYFLTKDGKAIDVTDLKSGDALALYGIGSPVKKYVGKVVTETVEGKVTAVSSSKHTVKIDGTTYKLADDEDALYAAFDSDLNSEVVAYLNEAGKVAMYEVVEEAAGNVAIIKSIRQTQDKYSNTFNNVEVVLYFSDGTVSDTLTVDKDETKDETGLDGVDAIVSEYKAGYPCCYSISGDKLTFKAATEDKEEYIDATGTLVFKKSNAYVNGTIEVDENTKFFQVKPDTEKTYKLSKVVELDYDSLDDTDFEAHSWIADIKYDGETPEYAGMVVFYGGKVERQTDLNLVFVEDFAEGKEEKTIDVITLDGKKASYTVDDDADVYDDLVASLVNKVIDIKVVDDVLVEIDKLAQETSGTKEDDTLNYVEVAQNAFVNKYNTKKTVMTIGADQYVFADDMLVLLYDDEEKEYKVSSIDEIDEYKDLNDVDEFDNVIGIVEYTDDASDTTTGSEVVLVVFQVKEK